MMILPMVAQMNAISQRNNAAFGAMQAHEAQLGLIRNLGFNSFDTFTPSYMNSLHMQDKRLTIFKLLNETLVKIANANLKNK